MKYLNQTRIILCVIIVSFFRTLRNQISRLIFNIKLLITILVIQWLQILMGTGRIDLVLHEHNDPMNIKVDGRKPRISWFKYPEYTNYTIALADFMGDRFAVEDINSDGSAGCCICCCSG